MGSLHHRWLLTGGIGSGKSEVRRLLAEHGIRTIDADSVGHVVLQQDALEAVSARWPDVVIDGAVDRSRLAGIVFAQPGELVALEAITHPLIFGRIESELEGFDGIAVVEVPVIDHGLAWPRIVVDSPDEMRLERIVARGMSRTDAENRMLSQPTRSEWLASADIVLPNQGSRNELRLTVAALLGHVLPRS